MADLHQLIEVATEELMEQSGIVPAFTQDSITKRIVPYFINGKKYYLFRFFKSGFFFSEWDLLVVTYFVRFSLTIALKALNQKYKFTNKLKDELKLKLRNLKQKTKTKSDNGIETKSRNYLQKS